MQKISLILVFILAFSAAFAQDSRPVPVTKADSVAYLLGFSDGEMHRQDSTEFDYDIFIQGMRDGLQGEPMLSDAEMQRIFLEFADEIKRKRQDMAEAYAKEWKAKGEAAKIETREFFESIEGNPNVSSTPEGLRYEIIREGEAGEPGPQESRDWVKAHIVTYLVDGTKVEDTRADGDPIEIPYRSLLEGMQIALQKMTAGAIWRLYIPPELALGELGAPEMEIPPNATLIMEVELIDFIEKPSVPRRRPENQSTPMQR